MALFRQFYSPEPAHQLLDLPGCLAVVTHNDKCAPASKLGVIPVGLEILGDPVNEVICLGNSAVERGRSGRCMWSMNQHAILVALWLEPALCDSLASATEIAYHEILALIQQRGFAHPVRAWNYLPNINHGLGDQERYKQFCEGRHQAFAASGIDHASYPAASALGHYSEGAVIYLLAGKDQPQHHENPAQLSAYQYPRQYGPKSPSFARATTASVAPDSPALFISGTASILGHASQAVDCIEQQITITMHNIDRLIDHIDANIGHPSLLKVYLRRREDLALTQRLVTRHYPNSAVAYVHADICRDSLLVEIEALCQRSKNSSKQT